jgi:chromosomal replication initiation ATPase DnaA
MTRGGNERGAWADRRRPAYLDALMAEAARRWKVTQHDILGPSRLRKCVRARQAVMWVLREQGLSFPHVAHLMERKDHTTVMHAVRETEASRIRLIGAMALELAVIQPEERSA